VRGPPLPADALSHEEFLALKARLRARLFNFPGETNEATARAVQGVDRWGRLTSDYIVALDAVLEEMIIERHAHIN